MSPIVASSALLALFLLSICVVFPLNAAWLLFNLPYWWIKWNVCTLAILAYSCVPAVTAAYFNTSRYVWNAPACSMSSRAAPKPQPTACINWPLCVDVYLPPLLSISRNITIHILYLLRLFFPPAAAHRSTKRSCLWMLSGKLIFPDPANV